MAEFPRGKQAQFLLLLLPAPGIAETVATGQHHRRGFVYVVRRLLFVEMMGGIGDLVIALPAIHALGNANPGAELTVFTFRPGGELLETDPFVHDVAYAQPKTPQNPNLPSESLAAYLHGHSFDLIVSDTNYGGIDGIIRNSGAARVVTNLWQRPPPDDLIGDRFLRLLLDEGLIRTEDLGLGRIYLTPKEESAAKQRYRQFPEPLVFLYVDSGMPIKRWPAESYVAVGRELRERRGATIVVPEGAESSEAARVVEEIGEGALLHPRGSIRDLAAALGSADLVVAADTGPARIAAALDTPTVTLFGPSWHGRYGEPPPHVNLQGFPGCPERIIHDLTLQRCWYSGRCPIRSWRTCLEDISPNQVVEAVVRLLEKESRNLAERPHEERAEAVSGQHLDQVSHRPRL